ncbi:MAG: HD domain-containing protein [Phaeodactylibacter xiamenensis]|uniref:HD domain-containing protein n=1 Tax=Phaeodactylibacter xiamenensis TaxID=1524460 RepID=UPI00069765FC|nr:HD domain-containing protein [Phaeodactylibacter xiamenensis]MCR9051510.1 HD domain-containing protein [bacterium]
MYEQNLKNRLSAALHKNTKAHLLFDYMKTHGDEQYEEEVTQLEHALQAAYLAKKAGKSPELITAALFHDIGHILADDPEEANNPTLKNDLHEDIAADYFRGLFPAAVLDPIRLHVEAKRYLCTVKAGYYEKLSVASQKSYHLQGGKMTDKEIAVFEGHEHYKDAVLLRAWDDLAKDLTKEVPAIETYEEEVVAALIK